MKQIRTLAVLAALLSASPVLAQQTGVPSAPATGIPADSTNPHASPKNTESTATKAAEEDKAGYTKKQARKQLKAAGYTKIQKLTQDKNGIWHAGAMKDGAKKNVSLDPQGNVTAE